MAATRTQVYLTTEQRRRLDEIAATQGKTLAQVVREAVDAYVSVTGPDSRGALDSTFGLLPDLEVPSRDEWDRG